MMSCLPSAHVTVFYIAQEILKDWDKRTFISILYVLWNIERDGKTSLNLLC